MTSPRISLLVLLGAIWSSVPAAAQPLGPFRWQLQPYCNVLTLNVTHQNGIYTLDGTDDRCGAEQAASAVGVAFLNPNGTVGFGITTVVAGGTALHLEAALTLATISGTWRDSSGNSGALVLTTGASTGGALRPVASGGVPAGTITAVQLANGAVGPSALATGAVGSSALAANAVTGGHVLDGSLTRADIADASRLMSHVTTSPVSLPDGGAYIVARQIPFTAPAAGTVLLNASGSFIFPSNATIDTAVCSLTTGVEPVGPLAAYAAEGSAASIHNVPFGGTRAFNVAAGSTTTFRLVCQAFGAGISIHSASLTALFVAGS